MGRTQNLPIATRLACPSHVLYKASAVMAQEWEEERRRKDLL